MLSKNFKLTEEEKEVINERVLASGSMRYVAYFGPRYETEDGKTPLELTNDEVVHEVLKRNHPEYVRLYDYYRFIEAFNRGEIADSGFLREFQLPSRE